MCVYIIMCVCVLCVCDVCVLTPRRAQKEVKVGEKGAGGADSPPDADLPDDQTDDVMTENGEIPEELSPVERIPPKDPLSLPVTKKQSPVESERLGGVTRGPLRVSRLPSTSGTSLSPGGVASPGGATPTASPRKGKKEDGWKEVGKRYTLHTHTHTHTLY